MTQPNTPSPRPSFPSSPRLPLTPLRAARRGTHHPEEGSALIDTALVMPIFLLFLFGFINFSLVMFGLCNITYATRLALRYASIHSNNSYTPTTQAGINALIAPFIYQYPTVTETTTVTFTGGNVVGGTVTLTTSLQYSLNLMGYTYTPTFNFTDQAPIIE